MSYIKGTLNNKDPIKPLCNIVDRLNYLADCFTRYTKRNKKEEKANARLIAAAPELLKACKEILTVIDNEGIKRGVYYGKAINMAEQAIAKAEGR